jgi:hypothetical protein
MICCISWFFKILNIVFCDLYTQNSMVQTNRSERATVSSTRSPRRQMVNYFTELQDTDQVVCNENSQVIFIYADEWTPIALTQWEQRE